MVKYKYVLALVGVACSLLIQGNEAEAVYDNAGKAYTHIIYLRNDLQTTACVEPAIG